MPTLFDPGGAFGDNPFMFPAVPIVRAGIDTDYNFGQASISIGRLVTSFSTLDNVYIFIPLFTCIDNLTSLPVDATVQSVQIAIVTGSPQSVDFKTADWHQYTGFDNTRAPLYARCQFGPLAGIILTIGIYNVFVQTNSTVQNVGRITVTA